MAEEKARKSLAGYMGCRISPQVQYLCQKSNCGAAASQEEAKEAKRALKRAIRKARQECCEEFLNRADGEDVWAIARYTKPH